MSNTAYSDLKAAWHTDKINDLRLGRQVVPSQVQLIISDLCNHDCHFCAYRMSNGPSSEQFGEDTGNGFTMNPNRRISTEKAIEIIDDCASLGVDAIQFTGGGEPTVHKDHERIFQHALNSGLKCGLVTNGHKMSRYLMCDILPRFDWVRVSVDACGPGEYAKIRRVKPSVYEKVIGNIKTVSEACRRDKTLLGVGYVITPENYKGLIGGVQELSKTGAHYVRLSAMFSTDLDSPFSEIYQDIKLRITMAREQFETDDFKIVDLFGDRIDDLKVGAPDYRFCGYQQFNCYVGGNLKVYRCCTTSYTKKGEVGDLSNKRFYEWFVSDEKARAYDTFDARICDLCQFNDKNKVINYMIDRNPLHVEFV